MGKSEVQSIPIHRPEPNLICVPAPCKSVLHTNQFANSLEKLEITEEDGREEIEEAAKIPEGYEKYNNQMAGHVNDNNIGK